MALAQMRTSALQSSTWPNQQTLNHTKRPTTRARGSWVFAKAKIYRFATDKRACRWLSLKCEPAHCRAVPGLISEPSTIQKDQPQGLVFLYGGGSWIRTSEVSDNRFTVCPLWPLGNSPIEYGAGERSRTINLLITNQLLCH